jgi:ABC-type Fe3+-hydroxamate transport system, periplasmic component
MTRILFKIVLIIVFALPLLLSCRGGGEAFSVPEECGRVFYARNLAIEELADGLTVVELRDPWDTLKLRQRYILADRSAAVPEGMLEGTLIRVPVEKAVVYTSVHASLIEQLGDLEAICGVCEPQYITSPEILRRVADGSIADLGLATSPNLEKIMDLESEIIIASPLENSGFGSAEKLGIPIVEAADYMENHPLGRTEWVKFYGLLFGRGSDADSIFEATANHYNELKALASAAKTRPTVLLEKKYGPAWAVPCGGSYIAQMHADAGAEYVFADVPGTNSKPLTFEKVLDRAAAADFWLFKYDGDYSRDRLKDEYPPYASFDAFGRGTIYGCNTLTTSYYDDITLHPDLVLEDFIAIYHPGLLPGHSQRYYLPLQ